MTGYIHVNGELQARDSVHVSALDRGFRYGDAIFETVRVYGTEPYAWDRHLDRLAASADALAMDHGVTRPDLRERVDETLEANDLREAYLRISISRGVQPGTLAPVEPVEPTVIIQTEPLPRGGVDGRPVWDGPATCTIAETRQIPNTAIPAHIKTHNYLNGILAIIEARTAGVDQPLLLDEDGYLTEAATANLFVVVDDVLYTPPVDELPVLPGITREDVITLASAADIQIEEERFTPTILDRADEVFLTNSTWEVRPVSRIDDCTYDTREVTETIARRYSERVERQCYDVR